MGYEASPNHEWSSTGRVPAAPNQWGLSHPAVSPKQAPRAASRSWEGTPPHATSSLRLAIGPVHGIEESEGLGDPFPNIGAAGLKTVHTANINIPQIHRGIAINDPIGKYLACASRRLNASRVKTSGDKKP